MSPESRSEPKAKLRGTMVGDYNGLRRPKEQQSSPERRNSKQTNHLNYRSFLRLNLAGVTVLAGFGLRNSG